MKKLVSFIYGVAAYLLFLGAFLYLVAFCLNIAPHSVSGTPNMPAGVAAMVDVALIMLFSLQHSIMARPWFKVWWTKMVPKHLERSTFVIIGSLMVLLICWGWEPIGGEIWNVTGTGAMAMYAISAIGWLTVPFTSFLTDHFELFGLRQVFEFATGRPHAKPEFKERGLYKKVRHPMMLGFLLALWPMPLMTVGSLLFCALMTAYILAGIHFEERDLARAHGMAYRAYQSRVPMLIPMGGASEAEQRLAQAKQSALESRG